MRIVIIGAGNVATVLGNTIKNAGHEILQVVSTHEDSAMQLARQLNCASTADINEIDKTAQIFIVAVSDTALKEYKVHFNVGDKLVVHTAGSVTMDVLRNISTAYGVLYPLQSLRREKQEGYPDIPFLVEANTPQHTALLKEFASTLSANVREINEEQRMKIHVAAVFASNFANHLYCLAADYCKSEKLDFEILQPLIEETALRIREHNPCDMQTGPAARKDIVTLDKHLRTLTAYPKLRTVYLRMTDSIMNP